MKKIKILGFLAVVAFVLTISGYLVHCAADAKKVLGSASDVNGRAHAVLDLNGCVACHSPDAKLPWYAAVPGAKATIEKDVQLGTRTLDLQPVLDALKSGEPVSEAELAKIEYTTQLNSMPPIKYYAVHWGTALAKGERSALLTWAAAARAKDYGKNTAAPEFQQEPVRPISNIPTVNPEKVSLGLALYNDTRISADNTISCATCHDLKKGGTDQLPVSIGIRDQEGPINAPTVFNAVYNLAQFWDGRTADLQEQASGPPLDMKEMGNVSFDGIVERLSADPALKARFAGLYPEGITQNSITDAIAEFEKTLITPNSAFDKYLKGDGSAMTPMQISGYDAFKRVGCATCHVGEALGGRSYEYVGLYGDYYADRGTEITDADKGRAKFTEKDKDLYRQKVPLLRNIALTPPYLHDATAKTVKDAVITMNTYQVKAKLSDEEIEAVTEFMNALTGEYEGELL